MTIYHRHLDHAWQETRRQINYSLFGNVRGDVATSRNLNWFGPNPWTIETLREERWRMKQACADLATTHGWSGANERKAGLYWLRYKEFES
ncbi:MAG: hypothetical protein RBR38_10520 [Desulfomicrobium apsheronum]|nr:hypothetical protein [Desulfomicrobium apsheronum]